MVRILARGTVFDARGAPPSARFCTFPSIVRLGDGRLLCAFRIGSSKDSADENIRIMRSHDEGRTWRTVFERFDSTLGGVPGSFRVGALTEVRPGQVLISLMWNDRSDPSRPLANPETQGILPSRLLVAQSEDGGDTWSALRDVPLSPHTGCSTTGSILRLRDGTLALPYEAWKEYDDPSEGTHHALLRFSSDGGETWSEPAVVAHDPENRLYFWDQRLSVSRDDGQLIAWFWTHDRRAGQDVSTHVAWGTPDGRTWTTPTPTGIAGQICQPVALPGGRVFGFYVHRHDPPTLRAILCRGEVTSPLPGRTLIVEEELIVYDSRSGAESGMQGRRDFGDYWADMNRWSFGHPDAVLLPSGDVFAVHYGGDSNAMGVSWVRIGL